MMDASLYSRVLDRATQIQQIPAPTFQESQRAEFIRKCFQAEGLELRILGGLGGVYLYEELLAGAAGAMTGFAYPEILVEVVRLFRAGKRDEAAQVFYRSVALMRFEFQEGIGMAIRKEVLRRRGAIAHAAVRAPAGSLDASTREALDRVLAWAGKTKEQSWTSA